MRDKLLENHSSAVVAPNTVWRAIQSTPLGILVINFKENNFSFENNVHTHLEEQLVTGVFPISDNLYSSSFYFIVWFEHLSAELNIAFGKFPVAEDWLIFSFSAWKAFENSLLRNIWKISLIVLFWAKPAAYYKHMQEIEYHANHWCQIFLLKFSDISPFLFRLKFW